MNDKITPCLYFSGEAEEAAEFYIDIFPASEITNVSRYGENSFLPAGTAMLVGFSLSGKPFQALNGPKFERTEAVSFSVACADQTEVDHYWERLTADGGSESKCGWLTDRYGFSWQIVPRRLTEIQAGGGPGAERAIQALLGMSKLDVAQLEAAYRGEA